MPIKKAHHERNQENASEIVISENNHNQFLETFISIKFDAICNETAPAISFHRIHGDPEILSKMMSEKGPVPL